MSPLHSQGPTYRISVPSKRWPSRDYAGYGLPQTDMDVPSTSWARSDWPVGVFSTGTLSMAGHFSHHLHLESMKMDVTEVRLNSIQKLSERVLDLLLSIRGNAEPIVSLDRHVLAPLHDEWCQQRGDAFVVAVEHLLSTGFDEIRFDSGETPSQSLVFLSTFHVVKRIMDAAGKAESEFETSEPTSELSAATHSEDARPARLWGNCPTTALKTRLSRESMFVSGYIRGVNGGLVADHFEALKDLADESIDCLASIRTWLHQGVELERGQPVDERLIPPTSFPTVPEQNGEIVSRLCREFYRARCCADGFEMEPNGKAVDLISSISWAANERFGTVVYGGTAHPSIHEAIRGQLGRVVGVVSDSITRMPRFSGFPKGDGEDYQSCLSRFEVICRERPTTGNSAIAQLWSKLFLALVGEFGERALIRIADEIELAKSVLQVKASVAASRPPCANASGNDQSVSNRKTKTGPDQGSEIPNGPYGTNGFSWNGKVHRMQPLQPVPYAVLCKAYRHPLKTLSMVDVDLVRKDCGTRKADSQTNWTNVETIRTRINAWLTGECLPMSIKLNSVQKTLELQIRGE